MKADGVRGLWLGAGPSIARNSIINAAEVASYDQYKQIGMTYFGLKDGIVL